MLIRFDCRVAVLAAACLLKFTAPLADDPTPAADATVSAATGAPAKTDAAVASAVPVAEAAAPAFPLASAALAAPATAASGRFEIADRVVVRKSTRRLLLMRDDRIVADYPIRLGLNPVGPKEREGDFRTPEGTYWLARRNQYSDFFLSIEVSYPNESDRSRARRLRTPPGGSIMIHGQPNFPRKPADYYARNDWTDGCIAVSNSDMVDIWLRTRIGLPIEIRP